MRAYFFGNMYLSQLQQGIQAGHVISEMSIKYNREGSDYIEWVTNHKTVILLNGGMSMNLRNIVNHFSIEGRNPYDWAYFTESEDALDGALTSVGIILPEYVYENALAIRQGKLMLTPSQKHIFDWEWEMDLYEIMNSCKLA